MPGSRRNAPRDHVTYLTGLFNTSEALEYARAEMGLSDDAADELVRSIEEAIQATTRKR